MTYVLNLLKTTPQIQASTHDIFINSQDFIVRCKMLKPDLKVIKSSVYLTLMTSPGSAYSIRSEFISTMTRISAQQSKNAVYALHVNCKLLPFRLKNKSAEMSR